MFRPLVVVVSSEGEHVLLTLGSSKWCLHYEVALRLSWAMWSAAKKSKNFAGDMTRVWSAIGILHDAEKGPDADQPFTPGGVYPVNRDVTKYVAAYQAGTLVRVRLGNAQAEIPYRAAFTIAQWLRLRAKEAKRRAGDINRHWSTVHAAAH